MQLLLDLLAQLGLGDPLVVEDRTELLDHVLVHLLAQLFERVRARLTRRPLLELLPTRCCWMRHRSAVFSCARARLPRCRRRRPVASVGACRVRTAPSCDRRAARSRAVAAATSACDDHRHAGVHRQRNRDVGRHRERRRGCRAPARSRAMSSFTWVFARLSTRRIFGPASASRSSVCMPTFRFLMLGMSMLADEQHVVGLFEQREHGVVEVRRHVDDHVAAHRLERAADGDEHRRRGSASASTGSVGAGRTQQPALVRVRRLREHLGVAELDRRPPRRATVCCGGMPSSTATSPNWRSASTSDDAFGVLARERDREVGRDGALADATLGGEDDDEATRRCPVVETAGTDVARTRPPSELADTSTACASAAPSPSTATRVARAGAERLLQQLCESSSTANTAPSSRVRGVSRCTCWKPYGHREHGPNTATIGRPGTDVLDELVDRLELRRAGELRPEAHPSRGSGSTTATLVASRRRPARSALPSSDRRRGSATAPEAGPRRPHRWPSACSPATAPAASGRERQVQRAALVGRDDLCSASSGVTSNVMSPLRGRRSATAGRCRPSAARRGLLADREHLDVRRR